MKYAFFELENWEKEYFQKEITGHELVFSESPLSDETPGIETFDVVVTFIHSQMKKELLDKMPNLKFITTMSTGFDHIDIEECKRRGIVVSNVPSYGETVVAEHTFALLLTISRRMPESIDRVKKGNFMPGGLTGFELRGKTIGVIGVGSIGSNVIRIARGFGMNAIVYKRTPDYALEKELGCKFVELPVLYQQSDIVSLHIPYTKETHHYIGDEAFSQMKDGVVILNTARGALIDTSALLRALDSGKVKAAGLDVLEEEPLLEEEKDLLSQEFDKEKILTVLQDHMLVNHPRVVITPHNAFNSEEALKKIVETTHENLTAFTSSAPVNVVSA
ncbi:MAG: NAD(P)-dependent oxidoreductase [Candidatus Levybacteria bacterium]|nr:NAD(P)-dependent oxidoreductase [Candidatus Levybacteria bacterium]